MIDFDALVLAECFATFGEEDRPTYTPASGAAPFAFDAIFDDAFMQVALFEDGAPGFVTSNPVIGVRLSQFPPGEPSQNGLIFIPRVNKTYLVNEPKPDGKGHVSLELNFVKAGPP